MDPLRKYGRAASEFSGGYLWMCFGIFWMGFGEPDSAA
jgi:hypothetical protein